MLGGSASERRREEKQNGPQGQGKKDPPSHAYILGNIVRSINYSNKNNLTSMDSKQKAFQGSGLVTLNPILPKAVTSPFITLSLQGKLALEN